MTGVRWANGRTRRAIDVFLAIVALVLVTPVLAVVAVVVRRAHGRPVVFRNERSGQHGVDIVVPKFRTMTDARGPDGKHLCDAQRLTRVGRKLRSMSLDELPQLWSVIRGDMSLIGPRPLPVSYLDRFTSEQRRRLEIKPGITGWAQVRGRNSLAWPDRLALDVWYVEHASPLLDLRILLQTVLAVVGRDGVTADGHATMPEFRGET